MDNCKKERKSSFSTHVTGAMKFTDTFVKIQMWYSVFHPWFTLWWAYFIHPIQKTTVFYQLLLLKTRDCIQYLMCLIGMLLLFFLNLEFFFLIWNTFWPSPLEGINASLFSFIFWESCSDTEARSKSPILLLQSIERVKQSGNTVQFISQDAAFGQLTFLTTESGTHLWTQRC